ncbi:MAG: TetR family transcriptional regulator [Actinobacteria bacterium]|nr:TetR family transcriptional regulator [Actinomycetota bacterium]
MRAADADGGARRPRGRNDPERPQRIVDAAKRLIARDGVNALTHRAIAEEADVPLGSTTYYFRSLDDIIVAALEQAIQEDSEKLTRWAEAVNASGDLARAITDRIMEDSSDRERELIWYRLYLWGATSPVAQELCYRWSRVMTTVLERFTDPRTAEVLSTLYDSLLMRVLISGGRVDSDDVERVVRSVLDAPGTQDRLAARGRG